jgi:capsular polysaccharide biosynthesis protein
MTAWQQDSLAMMGFPTERCDRFGDEQWQVENLLVPSLVGYPGMSHPWLMRWVRERLGAERTGPGKRRLYISRKNARYRRLVNEDEIIAALQPLGFDVVLPESLTFREQADLFGQAGWIVAVHGAGLANTMLAPRGTRVLEFITAEPEYISTSFYSICCALGHAYGNICVEYPQPRAPAVSELRRREDWVVPVAHMLDAFRLLEKA